MDKFDIVVVGAGIVGAATAYRLSQLFPQKNIVLLEKEASFAQHQSGRNSGVIHAGVYYPPGSLKARYCRQGLQQTLDFCRQYQIPYLQCGKLLVATNALEVSRMHALYKRCQENDLEPELLNQAQLRQREPNIQGEEAIWIKQTGITDYPAMTERLLTLFKQAGGQVRLNSPVQQLVESEQGIDIVTGQGARLQSQFLVNCAGLMADSLIRMLGVAVDFRIIPFRGEYFRLPAKYNSLVNHLIYPIPDPDMPFLGVHLTRMIDGSVTVGPNAVLALTKEGYGKTRINLADCAEMAAYPGFWSLLWRYKKQGILEMKNSLFRTGYLRQVQKYCARISLQDLLPYRPGVRAQAVSDSGELIHDFRFVQTQHSLHVGNAPSPAATSALPIADAIAEKVQQCLA